MAKRKTLAAKRPSTLLVRSGARRRFKTRIRQRSFLEHYARYGSIEIAADYAGVSWRLVRRWKQKHPWFKRRCEMALEQYLDRVEGTIVKKGVDDLELPALTFIARHRIPAYQPKPRELAPKTTINAVQQNNYASAQYSAAGLTDEELAFMDRCLRKMGVPEALLQAAPVAPVIDVEARAAVEGQPSRDDDRGPK